MIPLAKKKFCLYQMAALVMCRVLVIVREDAGTLFLFCQQFMKSACHQRYQIVQSQLICAPLTTIVHFLL